MFGLYFSKVKNYKTVNKSDYGKVEYLAFQAILLNKRMVCLLIFKMMFYSFKIETIDVYKLTFLAVFF